MSFIIGVTIGYFFVELIENTNMLLGENYINNQIISKNKITNINNFEDIENKKFENLKKSEYFISKNEVNYMNEISNNFQNKEWKIKIPKIGLEAIIEEGTSKEILNEFVGHFEETNRFYGNVGLAAHNRGYNVNYFEKIKYLEIGDEIYYSYCGKEKVYIVTSKNIIEDTNWELLKNTKDNRITLITCVENKPKNRLCLQGIEKNN